ncbi:MAG: hypothetical protein ACQEXQ_29050, partial [Bacillota bacterium]
MLITISNQVLELIIINKMLLLSLAFLSLVVISIILLKGNYLFQPVIITITIIGIILNRKYAWKPPTWYYVLIVLVIIFAFIYL